MATLAQQRCFNHALREAAARCPSCRQHFCRECVTEHDDRMICAACLAKELAGTRIGRPRRRAALRFAQAFTGLALLWVGFYLVGLALLELPASLHEGTLWEENWWDQP